MVAPEPGAAGDARRGLGMPAQNQYSTLETVNLLPVFWNSHLQLFGDVSVQVTKYKLCQAIVHANIRGYCWYLLLENADKAHTQDARVISVDVTVHAGKNSTKSRFAGSPQNPGRGVYCTLTCCDDDDSALLDANGLWLWEYRTYYY